jgi:putative FmdB family regulatory protein
MPLYEYECEACGHRFEKIQKFSDPPEQTCPRCGGVVRKLQASPAFQFKGSGWYVTDYAKKTDSKETKGPADAAKDAKGESAASKDTKATSTETAAKGDTAAPSAKESKS